MDETSFALELVAIALSVSLGAECAAGLALLEPVTEELDLLGLKALILRNFTGYPCEKQDSKTC